MFWLRSKKIIFSYALLSGGLESVNNEPILITAVEVALNILCPMQIELPIKCLILNKVREYT